MPAGDCFPTAAKLAAAIHKSGGAQQVLVVHGLPIGQGAHNAGLRYWHAWVELLPEGSREWAVADHSNGRSFTLLRKDWYRVGRIPQHLVWRYTLDQALAAIEEYGLAGPWMDRAKADALEEAPSLWVGATS